MKRLIGLFLVLAVAGTAAFVDVTREDVRALQRGDLAAMLDGVVNLPDLKRANAADSGTAVDIANYSSAAVIVATKQVDLTSTSKYLVLQDSTAGTAAWNMIDSIAIDSTDNKYYDLSYRGSKRYIRVLQRASGSTADTVELAAVIVRSGLRKR